MLSMEDELAAALARRDHSVSDIDASIRQAKLAKQAEATPDGHLHRLRQRRKLVAGGDDSDSDEDQRAMLLEMRAKRRSDAPSGSLFLSNSRGSSPRPGVSSPHLTNLPSPIPTAAFAPSARRLARGAQRGNMPLQGVSKHRPKPGSSPRLPPPPPRAPGSQSTKSSVPAGTGRLVWAKTAAHVLQPARIASNVSDGPIPAELLDGTVLTLDAEAIVGDANPFDVNHATDVADLMHLRVPSEASVLHCLRRRYEAQLPYTYAGPVLISLNPHTYDTDLYDTATYNAHRSAEQRPGTAGPSPPAAGAGEVTTTTLPATAPGDELLLSPSRHPRPDIDSRFSASPRRLFDDDPHTEASPHLFSLAETAFRSLSAPGLQRHTIVLLGCAGSGKTDASKKLMQYLVRAGDQSPPSEASAGWFFSVTREHKVLSVNAVLEALTCVRSPSGANTSQCCRFTQLTFAAAEGEGEGEGGGAPPSQFHPASGGLPLTGVSISVFLMNRSRVSVVPCESPAGHPAERNFHALYMLVVGASPELRQTLADLCTRARRQVSVPGTKITPSAPTDVLPASPTHFALLGPACTAAEASAYTEWFEDLDQAMVLLGFSDEERLEVYRILLAVLHLGNVEFMGEGDGEASIANLGAVEAAAALLGIAQGHLADHLLTDVVVVDKESVRVSLPASKLRPGRDTLCQLLYGQLVQWVVARLNLAMLQCMGEPPRSASEAPSIGILDAFGLVDNTVYGGPNALFTLFQNVVAERQWSAFITAVFKDEQELYTQQGAPFTPITFPANQELLDLLELAPSGLLPTVEAVTQSRQRRRGSSSSDGDNEAPAAPQSLVQVFLAKQKHHRFWTPEHDGVSFSIAHYQSSVTYDSSQLVDDNAAGLARVHETSPVGRLLAGSTAPLVKHLFPKDGRRESRRRRSAALLLAMTAPGVPTGATATVAAVPFRPCVGKLGALVAAFRTQLASLLHATADTVRHHVLCLQPNARQAPWKFDSALVHAQLRSLCVYKLVDLHKLGYPFVLSHVEFWSRYWVLHPKLLPRATKLSLGDVVSKVPAVRVADPGTPLSCTKAGLAAASAHTTYSSGCKRVVGALAGLCPDTLPPGTVFVGDAYVLYGAEACKLLEACRVAARFAAAVRLQALARGFNGRTLVKIIRETCRLLTVGIHERKLPVLTAALNVADSLPFQPAVVDTAATLARLLQEEAELVARAGALADSDANDPEVFAAVKTVLTRASDLNIAFTPELERLDTMRNLVGERMDALASLSSARLAGDVSALQSAIRVAAVVSHKYPDVKVALEKAQLELDRLTRERELVGAVLHRLGFGCVLPPHLHPAVAVEDAEEGASIGGAGTSKAMASPDRPAARRVRRLSAYAARLQLEVVFDAAPGEDEASVATLPAGIGDLVDMSRIKVAGLKREVARLAALPPITDKGNHVLAVARLVLNIRTAVLAQDWDEVGTLLAAVGSETKGLPPPAVTQRAPSRSVSPVDPQALCSAFWEEWEQGGDAAARLQSMQRGSLPMSPAVRAINERAWESVRVELYATRTLWQDAVVQREVEEGLAAHGVVLETELGTVTQPPEGVAVLEAALALAEAGCEGDTRLALQPLPEHVMSPRTHHVLVVARGLLAVRQAAVFGFGRGIIAVNDGLLAVSQRVADLLEAVVSPTWGPAGLGQRVELSPVHAVSREARTRAMAFQKLFQFGLSAVGVELGTWADVASNLSVLGALDNGFKHGRLTWDVDGLDVAGVSATELSAAAEDAQDRRTRWELTVRLSVVAKDVALMRGLVAAAEVEVAPPSVPRARRTLTSRSLSIVSELERARRLSSVAETEAGSSPPSPPPSPTNSARRAGGAPAAAPQWVFPCGVDWGRVASIIQKTQDRADSLPPGITDMRNPEFPDAAKSAVRLVLTELGVIRLALLSNTTITTLMPVLGSAFWHAAVGQAPADHDLSAMLSTVTRHPVAQAASLRETVLADDASCVAPASAPLNSCARVVVAMATRLADVRRQLAADDSAKAWCVPLAHCTPVLALLEHWLDVMRHAPHPTRAALPQVAVLRTVSTVAMRLADAQPSNGSWSSASDLNDALSEAADALEACLAPAPLAPASPTGGSVSVSRHSVSGSVVSGVDDGGRPSLPPASDVQLPLSGGTLPAASPGVRHALTCVDTQTATEVALVFDLCRLSVATTALRLALGVHTDLFQDGGGGEGAGGEPSVRPPAVNLGEAVRLTELLMSTAASKAPAGPAFVHHQRARKMLQAAKAVLELREAAEGRQWDAVVAVESRLQALGVRSDVIASMFPSLHREMEHAWQKREMDAAVTTLQGALSETACSLAADAKAHVVLASCLTTSLRAAVAAARRAPQQSSELHHLMLTAEAVASLREALHDGNHDLVKLLLATFSDGGGDGLTLHGAATEEVLRIATEVEYVETMGDVDATLGSVSMGAQFGEFQPPGCDVDPVLSLRRVLGRVQRLANARPQAVFLAALSRCLRLLLGCRQAWAAKDAVAAASATRAAMGQSLAGMPPALVAELHRARSGVAQFEVIHAVIAGLAAFGECGDVGLDTEAAPGDGGADGDGDSHLNWAMSPDFASNLHLGTDGAVRCGPQDVLTAALDRASDAPSVGVVPLLLTVARLLHDLRRSSRRGRWADVAATADELDLALGGLEAKVAPGSGASRHRPSVMHRALLAAGGIVADEVASARRVGAIVAEGAAVGLSAVHAVEIASSLLLAGGSAAPPMSPPSVAVKGTVSRRTLARRYQVLHGDAPVGAVVVVDVSGFVVDAHAAARGDVAVFRVPPTPAAAASPPEALLCVPETASRATRSLLPRPPAGLQAADGGHPPQPHVVLRRYLASIVEPVDAAAVAWDQPALQKAVDNAVSVGLSYPQYAFARLSPDLFLQHQLREALAGGHPPAVAAATIAIKTHSEALSLHLLTDHKPSCVLGLEALQLDPSSQGSRGVVRPRNGSVERRRTVHRRPPIHLRGDASADATPPPRSPSMSAVSMTMMAAMKIRAKAHRRHPLHLANFGGLRAAASAGVAPSASSIVHLLRWSPEPLTQPLTCLVGADAASAVSLSRQLLGAMGDVPFSYPDSLVWEVVCHGVRAPQMRDEIFCQVLRQLTSNPSPASRRRGWGVLDACLQSFLPSDDLENFVEVFLRVGPRMDLVRTMHATAFVGGARACPPLAGVVDAVQRQERFSFEDDDCA